MNLFEIIGGVLLLVACAVLVIVIIMQEAHTAGTQRVDRYELRNPTTGKTANQGPSRGCWCGGRRFAPIAFFAITILINLFSVILK